MLAALLSITPLAVACSGKAIIDDASGGSSAGGNGAGNNGAGNNGAGNNGAGNSGTGAGSPTAYDAVVIGDEQVNIGLASFTLTCAFPNGPPIPDPCDYWSVSIRLPGSMLVPGVLDLDHPMVNATASFGASDPSNPDLCSGGGGTFIGEVEIVTVDTQQVVLSLSDADLFEVPPGSYTAERCP